jgi:hypothetical protein|tara:strand:+ start:1961 stop:2263 length:303 start_codon:yes stop_codon:yes gene_type:complete
MSRKNTKSKKKAMYRSILVNNRKYYFYQIRWVDILGDSGHKSFLELSNMKPAYKSTFAFLFKKSKKFLYTFSTYDEVDEEFSDCNVFPIGTIIETKRIEI